MRRNISKDCWLAARRMVITALFIFCFSPASGAGPQDRGGEIWCSINPPPVNGTSFWDPVETIRLVQSEKQKSAKALLSKRQFVGISYEAALNYAPPDWGLQNGGFHYLVRATAFGFGEDYKRLESSPSFPFKGHFSPELGMLAIINFSLSNRNSKYLNLALLVQTQDAISDFMSLCATAE